MISTPVIVYQPGPAYREGVATDIVGAHRKIRNLQVLDSVDIQSLVQDTMLDDAVTLFRSNTASTKRMPCSLDVALYPFLNMFD